MTDAWTIAIGAAEMARAVAGRLDALWRGVVGRFLDFGVSSSFLDLIFLLLVWGFAFGVFRILRSGGGEAEGFWRRGAVMTPNEIEFHSRLRRACPEYEFWPQVSMLALLQPKFQPVDAASWRSFSAISSRRVDWVLAIRGAPRLIVELDDRTHDPAADARRDALLAACGWPVLRFDSRKKPDAERLRVAVNDALAKMERREAA